MVDSGKKWGIIMESMLMGEYHHSLDEKGRLIIPTKFRNSLKEEFILTRGLDNCLFGYSKEVWEELITKLEKLPFTQKDARSFIRFFLSGATICEVDKQGRIRIPAVLSTYAGLVRDCVIIGVGDRMEIWQKEKWEKFLSENEEKLSEMAEGLFSPNSDSW